MGYLLRYFPCRVSYKPFFSLREYDTNILVKATQLTNGLVVVLISVGRDEKSTSVSRLENKQRLFAE